MIPAEPTVDQELLLWLGDEPLAVKAPDAERIREIAAEFALGLDGLARIGPAVTVLGSARTPETHPHYRLIRRVGAELGRAGCAVITGGGPGLMEAANRGARDVGALSVGCNIELPHEEHSNDDPGHQPAVSPLPRAQGDVHALCQRVRNRPGCFGTLDELFELLTLIQTRTIRHFPVVLMGEGEWDGLLNWLRGRALADRRSDAEDWPTGTRSPSRRRWSVSCLLRASISTLKRDASGDAGEALRSPARLTRSPAGVTRSLTSVRGLNGPRLGLIP